MCTCALADSQMTPGLTAAKDGTATKVTSVTVGRRGASSATLVTTPNAQGHHSMSN
jgi:hypothetical protein